MNYKKSGHLLYKCRRCGVEFRFCRVRDCSLALSAASGNLHKERVEEAHLSGLSVFCIHSCKAKGRIGLADLVGAEYDPDEDLEG